MRVERVKIHVTSECITYGQKNVGPFRSTSCPIAVALTRAGLTVGEKRWSQATGSYQTNGVGLHEITLTSSTGRWIKCPTPFKLKKFIRESDRALAEPNTMEPKPFTFILEIQRAE